MLGTLKWIAALGRAIFGGDTSSGNVRPQPAAVPGTGSAPNQAIGNSLPFAANQAAKVALKITVSRPEPLSAINPDNVLLAPSDVAGPIAREPVRAKPRAATTLRCQRRIASPIAAQRAAGRSIATKPRRAKPAVPTRVRTNLVSADSVRMQAALMRCQRRRDAERALAKISALKPSATIHKLPRAA